MPWFIKHPTSDLLQKKELLNRCQHFRCGRLLNEKYVHDRYIHINFSIEDHKTSKQSHRAIPSIQIDSYWFPITLAPFQLHNDNNLNL